MSDYLLFSVLQRNNYTALVNYMRLCMEENMKKRYLQKISLFIVITTMIITTFSPISLASETRYFTSKQSIKESVATVYNYETEYQRAKEGISDIPINNEEETCKATITKSDGTVEEFNVFCTIRNLGQLRSSKTTGTVYVLSAFAEQRMDSGSTYDDILGTSASGRIVWIDNVGFDNELVEVSGSWSSNGYQIDNQKVWYGARTNDPDDERVREPSSLSFKYSGSGIDGWVLYLETYATFDGNALRLNVQSTFDND